LNNQNAHLLAPIPETETKPNEQGVDDEPNAPE